MSNAIPSKKLLLASMISMLVACGSDNDSPPPPIEENSAPVAVADSASVMVSETVTIDVLANDTDADGDTLSIVSVNNSSAVINQGKVEFSAGDTAGEVKFNYTITDGKAEAVGEVTVTVEPLPEPEVLAYVGSAACAGCHSELHQSFVKTGHNFKIQKINGGEQPAFPYTPETTITGAIDLLVDSTPNNTLGAPKTYEDVSYVVGGYHWKMRWMDKNGFIVTGKDVQYNIRNAKGELNIPDNHPADPSVMGDYKASEFDVKYSCGNCHTTGWKRTTDVAGGDNRNADRQDNLPGMNGTFAEQGIQCESCHGAGSFHVKAPSKTNITKMATARTTDAFLAEDMAYGQPVTCAECHTRDGEKDYPTFVSPYNAAFPNGSKVGGRIIVSGGLGQHHQTADELLGVVPQDYGSYKAGDEIGGKQFMACVTCHEPHKSTVNQNSSDGLHAGSVKACSDCHTMAFTDGGGSFGHKSMAECTDCHMPKLAKSALTTAPKMGGADVVFGDVRSHLFALDLSPQAKQISDDGKFLMPWGTAKYTCGNCHADYTEKAAALPKVHK
ncbi:Ig-like domain-containing protein [Shewanella sp.]|uniref:Ig-like domain-containing protein n=1 Tax=Shewanella sp. TaxID=50422 RepID=UPI0035644CE9